MQFIDEIFISLPKGYIYEKRLSKSIWLTMDTMEPYHSICSYRFQIEYGRKQ